MTPHIATALFAPAHAAGVVAVDTRFYRPALERSPS
jgi:hypothetical protein